MSLPIQELETKIAAEPITLQALFSEQDAAQEREEIERAIQASLCTSPPSPPLVLQFQGHTQKKPTSNRKNALFTFLNAFYIGSCILKKNCILFPLSHPSTFPLDSTMHFIEHHLRVDSVYNAVTTQSQKVSHSFAHYTATFNSLKIHVHFDENAYILLVEARHTPSEALLTLEPAVIEQIKLDAVLAQNLLTQYIHERTQKHQEALKTADTLEVKLSLFSRQLYSDSNEKNTLSQYIHLAKDFIKAIEQVNLFSQVTEDKRGNLVKERIRALEALMHQSSPSTNPLCSSAPMDNETPEIPEETIVYVHPARRKNPPKQHVPIKKNPLIDLECSLKEFKAITPQTAENYIQKHQLALDMGEQIIFGIFDPQTTKSQKKQLKRIGETIEDFYDLSKFFKAQVKEGYLDAAKILFPHIQAKILPEFYAELLQSLIHISQEKTLNKKEELQKGIQMCHFFYNHSDIYRLTIKILERYSSQPIKTGAWFLLIGELINKNHLEIFEMLLEHGCNPNCSVGTDHYHAIPMLHLAIMLKHGDPFVAALIKKGVDVNRIGMGNIIGTSSETHIKDEATLTLKRWRPIVAKKEKGKEEILKSSGDMLNFWALPPLLAGIQYNFTRPFVLKALTQGTSLITLAKAIGQLGTREAHFSPLPWAKKAGPHIIPKPLNTTDEKIALFQRQFVSFQNFTLTSGVFYFVQDSQLLQSITYMIQAFKTQYINLQNTDSKQSSELKRLLQEETMLHTHLVESILKIGLITEKEFRTCRTLIASYQTELLCLSMPSTEASEIPEKLYYIQLLYNIQDIAGKILSQSQNLNAEWKDFFTHHKTLSLDMAFIFLEHLRTHKPDIFKLFHEDEIIQKLYATPDAKPILSKQREKGHIPCDKRLKKLYDAIGYPSIEKIHQLDAPHNTLTPEEKNTLLDIKKMIASAEMDINRSLPHTKGCTVLHYACHNGLSHYTDELLIHRIWSINKANDKGQTALHFACKAGHIQITVLLIINGADIAQQDKEGLTAFDKIPPQKLLNIIQEAERLFKFHPDNQNLKSACALLQEKLKVTARRSKPSA